MTFELSAVMICSMCFWPGTITSYYILYSWVWFICDGKEEQFEEGGSLTFLIVAANSISLYSVDTVNLNLEIYFSQVINVRTLSFKQNYWEQETTFIITLCRKTWSVERSYIASFQICQQKAFLLHKKRHILHTSYANLNLLKCDVYIKLYCIKEKLDEVRVIEKGKLVIFLKICLCITNSEYLTVAFFC